MKQILIKLAALGLLFSVVSTFACDRCGCKHKAGESINVHDVEGKHRATGYPVLGERSNDDKMRVGEVNEDGKKRNCGGYEDPCPDPQPAGIKRQTDID